MKITKVLSLTAAMLVLTTNLAFADQNVNANSQNSIETYKIENGMSNSEMLTRGGTIFEACGGHGEWGHGMFNMWGKFWHSDKSHRVVLKKDNSSIYGAWEDGGSTPSYRETSVGDNMNATGEVR